MSTLTIATAISINLEAQFVTLWVHVKWPTVVRLEGLLLVFREFCEFGNTHYSSNSTHSQLQAVILQVLCVDGGVRAQVSVRDELCKTYSICFSIEDKYSIVVVIAFVLVKEPKYYPSFKWPF